MSYSNSGWRTIGKGNIVAGSATVTLLNLNGAPILWDSSVTYRFRLNFFITSNSAVTAKLRIGGANWGNVRYWTGTISPPNTSTANPVAMFANPENDGLIIGSAQAADTGMMTAVLERNDPSFLFAEFHATYQSPYSDNENQIVRADGGIDSDGVSAPVGQAFSIGLSSTGNEGLVIVEILQ